MSPSNGRSSSRIKKMAPAAHKAEAIMAKLAVGLAGAIKLKPRKIITSQRTTNNHRNQHRFGNRRSILMTASRLRRVILCGERRFLERLRQLPAEISDEFAQRGHRTGCAGVRSRALARETAGAGLQHLLSAR